MFPSLQNDLILRAARGEPVERVPVWIMRQAGRHLQEYKDFMAQPGMDFFTVCRNPELVVKVTMLPIHRYPKLDAAIIFSDILVIPQAMGMQVQMVPGLGPQFPNPIRSPDDLKRIELSPNTLKALDYVYKAIEKCRFALNGKCPLIGFAGAPWTLFAYMIEGGGSKTFSYARRFVYMYPEATDQLLSAITNVIIDHLMGQIEAGAQLVQIFDSWAGELPSHLYIQHVMEHMERIPFIIRKRFPDVPIICFPKGAPSIVQILSQKQCYDVISLDWNMDPATLRRSYGTTVGYQGNLDPCLLYASQTQIYAGVQNMLQSLGKTRTIANLGHGVYPDVSPDHVEHFLNAVHLISSTMDCLKQIA